MAFCEICININTLDCTVSSAQHCVTVKNKQIAVLFSRSADLEHPGQPLPQQDQEVMVVAGLDIPPHTHIHTPTSPEPPSACLT